MAEKDVLSQEEIDALLESVDETEEAAAVKAEANAEVEEVYSSEKKEVDAPSEENAPEYAADHQEDDEGVKSFKFIGKDRFVKGQLPVLDKIYDRAVRLFMTDIYHLTGKDFEVKQDPLQTIKHRDFMSSLPNPTLMTIYKFEPLRGKGLILFDNIFIYDLVDYYFGGSTQFYAQKIRTDYTATELKVMDSLNKKLVTCLSYAWSPIISLNIIKFNEETNTQLVNITEPEEMLLVSKFNLDFGKESGSFSFILPYSMVEPIKQQLELGASRSDDEIDPNWIKLLTEELMDVELTISSYMAKTEGILDEVMEWKSGDFIPMEMNEIVTLDIEGIPSFTATLGSANDKCALKIIDIIKY